MISSSASLVLEYFQGLDKAEADTELSKMADIYRSVMSESDVGRTARRRRSMDHEKVEFVPKMAPPEMEDHRKRQKLEAVADSFSRDCRYAVDSYSLEEDEGLVKLECRKPETMESSPSPPSSGLSISLLCQSPAARVAPEVPVEYPRFGVVSIRGRRREMEDAVTVQPSFCRIGHESNTHLHYFAVYDGHGCSHAAIKCKERLHELVKEELEREFGSPSSNDWKSAMERSFRRMDEEVSWCSERTAGSNCKCELHPPECNMVGTTAVAAILTPEKIIVSNCGDSRAVLCRSGKPVPLSSDHKPDRPDELNRIEAAGGQVIYWGGPRVLGVLATSRAIGDNYLKPYVSCDPEVTITDRSPEDDFLLIGSDGLWDVVSNATACEVARMCLQGKFQRLPPHCSPACSAVASPEIPDKGCSDAVTLLSKLALGRKSADNVSLVIVDLRRDRSSPVN